MSEFKNEQVAVTVTKKEHCAVELHVIASKSLVEQAKKAAIKAVNKEGSFPGFRPGKAPEELVLKKYPEAVEKEWRSQIGDMAFVATEKLVNIPPLSRNSSVNYNLKHIDNEKAEATYTFETHPTVPTMDVSAFHLTPIQRREIAEKEIEEAIRQVQFYHATWTEVDRPIQENDYVIVDLESLEKEPPLKVFSDTRFEISEKGVANWMKQLVLGAKKLDVLEGISKPDDNAPEAEKAQYTPTKVRVTIKKVEEAVLPPLDDVFAQKVGSENVESFRKYITESLNHKADEKVDHEEREQVNQWLVTTYPFDLPKSLLDDEIKFRKNDFFKDPKNKVHWNKITQEERQKVEEEIVQRAKEAVFIYFIARKILEEAKITLTQDDVLKEALFDLFLRGNRQPKPQDVKEEDFAKAYSHLMLRRAQDVVLEKVKKRT